MKLSLRDLFWLVLIVGMGIAFGLQRSQLNGPYRRSLFDTGYRLKDPNKPSMGSLKRLAMLAELRDLTYERLLARLDSVEDGPGYDRDSYSCCLTELVRRGMKQELSARYRRHMDVPDSIRQGNDPLLTALRRAEGKPDPVKIEVQSVGRDSSGNRTRFPLIVPKVTCADIDREQCALVLGSCSIGHHSQWRVRLIGEDGQVLDSDDHEVRETEEIVYDVGMWNFGHSLERCPELDARWYMKPPPSGRYVLELLHSNDRIADEPNLDGLFVWKSAPVHVIVHNPHQTSKWVAVLPPYTILAATGLIAFFRRYWTAQWLGRNDWIALTIIALLALSWSIDILYMKHTISQKTSGFHATWTMELVQPTS